MLINVSDNNLKKIEEIIQQHNFENIFLLDYAASIEPFLEYMLKVNPGVKRIFCLTEKSPKKRKDVLEFEEQPWAIKDYIQFFTAKKRINFDDHVPVCEGDESRISKWRRQHAMGPFLRVSEKIKSIIGNNLIARITDYLLCIPGIVTLAFFPRLRKKRGRARFRRGSTDIQIIFDGGPEKDHYGESPLLEARFRALEEWVLDVAKNQNSKTGFFIITGPRHEYIEKILSFKKDSKIKNFAIFACALFRTKPYEAVEKIGVGSFFAGSNVSIQKNPVYSDHCLSIGAGEKELWCYLDMDA